MAGKKITELNSGSLSNLPLSGVTAVVYSGLTLQHTLSDLRLKLVDSGSHVFTGSQVINGNLTVSGSITAQQYILSSSITNITTETISGSSNFGNSSDDKHTFTGSVNITGSLTSNNIIVGPISEILSGSQYTAAHIATSNSINIVHFEGNDPYYSQVNITNTNSGNNASSDLVLTADNGNETVHFVDLGINSSTYTGGLVGRENDAYLLNVGKDLYIGTVGGTNHPAKLYLFAENNWENPQITIHTGSQVTFNTSGYTDGFLYEFSGSVKLQDELKVDGSVTSSYFVGDGSQLTNLPIQTTDVSMFLSSSTFNSFTQSVDGRLDSLESVTSSYFTFNENTMSMVTGENMIFQTSYSGTVIGTATETATDSQGGQDTITFAAWIEGSGGTDYPTIVNVQPNWKASGPGLSVGATVASVNTLVFSPGQSVYQITLNSGYGLFQTSQTYTFTEPDTSGTITKNWVFESGSNLIVPSGGNVIGAQNLATTGSNRFNGNQTITGSLVHGNPGNIATGEESHAEGEGTQAIGNFSHAEGLGTIAYGNYSHSEGQDTIASGSHSHTEGKETIALADHQHVQGQYNAVSSVPAAFIVGNGTDSENRSNLIHAAGNEVQITGSLSVSGSLIISGSGSLNGNTIVSSNTIQKIETISSASYASITPISGTLYIIID